MLPTFHLVLVINAKLFWFLKSPLNMFRQYSTDLIFLKEPLMELSDLIWFRPVALYACCSVFILQYLFTNILGDPLYLSLVSDSSFLLSVVFLVCYLILVKHILQKPWNTSSRVHENIFFFILNDWKYLFYLQTRLIVWLGMKFEVGDHFSSEFWKDCLSVF